MQDNIKPTEIEPYTRQQFEMADADGDGAVNFEEFTHFYQALTTSKARRELRSIMGPHAESRPQTPTDVSGAKDGFDGLGCRIS